MTENTGTFWQLGERVTTRFGGTVGTVVDMEITTETVYANAFDDEGSTRTTEWVLVYRDDGELHEWAAYDLRRAE